MTRKAVIICPGRGTYNKNELGVLKRLHADKAALFDHFDALRKERNQTKPLSPSWMRLRRFEVPCICAAITRPG